MVIPAVLLVLLAIAVIRSLMEVVAHDDEGAITQVDCYSRCRTPGQS